MMSLSALPRQFLFICSGFFIRFSIRSRKYGKRGSQLTLFFFVEFFAEEADEDAVLGKEASLDSLGDRFFGGFEDLAAEGFAEGIRPVGAVPGIGDHGAIGGRDGSVEGLENTEFRFVELVGGELAAADRGESVLEAGLGGGEVGIAVGIEMEIA